VKKRLLSIFKVVVPLLVGVYLIWYFYSKLSPEEKDKLFSAFANANYWWILLSLLLGWLSHLSRSYRWKFMFEPLGEKLSFWSSYHSIMIGYIVNMIVPRLGEASRAGVVAATDDIPFEKSFGTIIAERVVDVIFLGIITGTAIILQYDRMDDLVAVANSIKGDAKESTATMYYILLGIAIAGIIGLLILIKIKPTFKTKIIDLTKGFIAGLKTIFTMKKKWYYLFHSAFIWVMYVAMFWVCFYSLEETSNIGSDGIMAGFIAGTIGFILVQGGLGVYPLFVGTVITLYLNPELLTTTGQADGSATGLAWLIWGSQTVLILICGLISLYLVQVKKKRKAKEISGEA
jgi:uncharacterized protein (TIRG00374 family)